MKKKQTIQHGSGAGIRLVSVLMMCMCLLLLTGANFFVDLSNGGPSFKMSKNAVTDENEAPNPGEENAKSNSGISIQEEYLYEKHSFKNEAWLTLMLQHRILEVEKLQMVPADLVSPPPKIC